MTDQVLTDPEVTLTEAGSEVRYFGQDGGVLWAERSGYFGAVLSPADIVELAQWLTRDDDESLAAVTVLFDFGSALEGLFESVDEDGLVTDAETATLSYWAEAFENAAARIRKRLTRRAGSGPPVH